MNRPFLKIFLFSFCFSLAQTVFSQSFGNDWINFNQTYFKISVGKTGFYKLNYDDLQSAGFPVETVDPRKIQLIFRGKEMAIEVAGQLDARFDPADHIIFFGMRNDGLPDAPLYVEPAAQPHPYYNLFSDSTAYFLTWRLDNQNGRRVQNFFENNVENLPSEPFYNQETLLLQTSNYSAGRTYPEGSDGFTQLASFDYGEGWTGERIRNGQSADFTIAGLSGLYKDGGKPVIEVFLAGRNNRRHKVELQAGSSPTTLRSLGEVEFNYYNIHKFVTTLEWTDISGAGDMVVRVRVKGFDDGVPDYASLSCIRVKVPRQWEIMKDTLHLLELNANPLNKSFLRINNELSTFSIYDVTDPYSVIRIGYNHSGGITTAIVDKTSTARQVAITGSLFLSAILKPVSFKQIEPVNYNYLIISHQDLMKPSPSFDDPVQAYADYRASSAGGSLKPLVMEMDQVYDQFGYGEKTPLAIRNLCAFMLTGNRQYLFLIGKGLDIAYNYYRQDPTTYAYKNFVPAAGFPASDILFSAGLNGSGYAPAIPTGRITAQSPADVETYLNKIVEMEGKPYDALWRKEFIHLSGGYSLSELTLFRQYAEEFGEIAEGDFLGGKADIISKTSNNSTELINISGEVNNGKAMITFFGHSGGILTDLDIGFVSDDGYGYLNRGKYPVFLINGCNAGQIFATSKTLGDDWILTPGKGAIAFIASPTLGYAGYLKRYTDIFYTVAFADSAFIGKPLGVVHQETSRRFVADVPENQFYISQAQEMLLQGDPYYRMFGVDLPDYAIGDTDMMIRGFNGEKISALADSFQIGAVIRNFGRTTRKPLYMAVERESDQGGSILYDPQVFEPVKYLDTLWLTVRNAGYEGSGKNNFRIYVDIADSVAEINENNNIASFNYFIPSHTVRNVAPADYAVVNKTLVELIAQSTNLLDEPRDYLVELDTSAYFNSAFKQQWTINAKVLVRQQVELLDMDSLAYFWRIRFIQPSANEDDGWAVSSFTYIKDGPEGWAQTRYSQIVKNAIDGLVPEDDSRELVLQESETAISLKTFGANHTGYDYDDVELFINGLSYIFSTRFCTDNSMNAIAFDKSSTIPYLGLNFGGWDILDRRSCGRRPQVVNNFLNQEIENSSYFYLNKFIDSIPEGDYVLLFSIGSVTYENWPLEVKTKVNELGISSDLFTKLKAGDPVIILGKKGGAAGSAIEIIADPASGIPADQQELTLNYSLTGKRSKGFVQTNPIGPATAWYTLFSNMTWSENPADDFYSFEVTGISRDRTETVIFQGIQDREFDLGGINPVEYPYIRLKYHTQDEMDFTPPQLRNWVVSYEPVAEGILLPAEGESQFPGLRQEGEQHPLAFTFENLSFKDFPDSIPVTVSNYNPSRRISEEFTLKIPAVKARTKAPVNLSIPTVGKSGKNDLRIEANPGYSPEQHYFNNLVAVEDYLEVKKDQTNPALELLVDGRHIMDGDIVSPSPLIVARLKDENRYLWKQDTSGVSIMIKKDCEGCPFKRIDFSNPNVKWTPASASRDFQVEYQSEPLEDGVYILQVQAADASGNNSGANPFRVRFEVANESAITHFYPYPNPFSSKVRFVFTLTGSEIPEKIKIRIMTISGRIVREIDQDELGPIHIGHNITEYAWDGRDEYGDQLANGVYLYKVMIYKDGKTLEHRETSADKAFRNGFGKMYLLR